MSIWFNPICDRVLKTVGKWYADYNHDLIHPDRPIGKVYGSKSYLNLDGRLEDKPTIFIYDLKFTVKEMEHFVRILKTVNPDKESTEVITKVSEGLKRGILIPPDYYLVKLALYPMQVKEILDALVSARNGTYLDPKISETIDNQEGKAPFEI